MLMFVLCTEISYFGLCVVRYGFFMNLKIFGCCHLVHNSGLL